MKQYRELYNIFHLVESIFLDLVGDLVTTEDELKTYEEALEWLKEHGVSGERYKIEKTYLIL